jgi:GNAT superfamily N-acetyltransferase
VHCTKVLGAVQYVESTMDRLASYLEYGVAIRRLWPTDQSAYAAHLKRLDPDSRYARFNGSVSDSFIDTHTASSFGLETLIYGAFDGDQLIGAGELRMAFDAWPPKAEAAFSVEQKWQDHGLGDALVMRVLTAARNRGITSVAMQCLAYNDRMRHLALKHHAQIETSHGETEAHLPISGFNPATFWAEAMGEAGSLFSFLPNWTRATAMPEQA